MPNLIGPSVLLVFGIELLQVYVVNSHVDEAAGKVCAWLDSMHKLHTFRPTTKATALLQAPERTTIWDP